MDQQRRADDLVEFGPLLLANALPLVGIVGFDAAHTTVFLLYLFEMLALFVAYCGCALFAQRETVTEGRTVGAAVAGSDEGTLSRLPAIPLPGSLPAVQLRSLRVILPTAALVALLFVGIGDLLVGAHEAYDPFPSWLSAFAAPTVSGPALAIAGSHAVYVHRGYFRPGRYEEMSAATVLEFPVRLVVVLCPAVMLVTFAFVALGGLASAVASRSVADRVGTVALLGGFFLVKTGVDWARFRAERSAAPGGLAGWLAPAAFRPKGDE